MPSGPKKQPILKRVKPKNLKKIRANLEYFKKCIQPMILKDFERFWFFIKILCYWTDDFKIFFQITFYWINDLKIHFKFHRNWKYFE